MFSPFALAGQPQFPQADNFYPFLSGTPSAIVIQPDGRIVVGGTLAVLGGMFRTNIVRLNPDGNMDDSFAATVNGNIACLSQQADGKILLAGNFSMVNGEPRQTIARLSIDGMLDPGFKFGATGAVYAVLARLNGDIVTAGKAPYSLPPYIGPDSYFGIRINPNGQYLGTFYANYDISGIYAFAAQADGKLLCGFGGGLNRYTKSYTGDGYFPMNGSPTSVAVQPDGKIVLAGYFPSIGPGGSRSNLCRLNPDLTLDLSFTASASGISTIALQADGKIIVGGTFTELGGLPRSNIGRLNADGTVDTTFDPGANGPVTLLAMQTDGKVIVGGSFTQLGGLNRNGIGRINSTAPAVQNIGYDGTTIKWYRGGASPEVWRVEFEAKIGDSEWMTLGAGTWNDGAWQIIQPGLPTNTRIRARGSVSGGYRNNSGWSVESVLDAPYHVVPIVARDHFGIGFDANPDRTYTLEFTDALNKDIWKTLISTSAVSSIQILSDTNGFRAARFYRLRVE